MFSLIQAHLKEHSYVHTSERPYLCDKCGASFKSKGVQRKHILETHINPGAFKCSVCPKSFNQKCSLLSHIQRHHKHFKSNNKPVTETIKTVEEEVITDPFGNEGEGQLEVQGQDLQVQEVQLQFHLQDYGGQVTLVPEEGGIITKGDSQTIQITSSDGQDYEGQQIEGHDLEGQFLQSEQATDETMDENLTAIQTITLPQSQLRHFTQPIQTTEGEEIYIQNFTTDDGDSFDPTRESVRQLYIPSSMVEQTSVIEVDGSTTFIQGAESLIGEVKTLGSFEGLQSNQAILTINTDGTEKVFLANVENVENV